MRDLSVIIPARNEEWLKLTVEDVLRHSHANTEVIVVCDGGWPTAALEMHPRVQVVYVPEAIGQRAATNIGAKISTARYIAKLDAHCSVGDGWDVELIRTAEELGDDVTQIPAQKNLHVFSWVCTCGWQEYQGPRPSQCGKCSAEANTLTREIVWKPRRGTTTTTWRFDHELHFQYFGQFEERPEAQGELTDTMCCLGACWFLSRDRYWQIGGLDEGHGSWGAMGVELACKSWLSGGRMLTNRRTHFSHLFRTRADFSFPYQISGSDQERARKHSRHLWLGNRWPGQVRPLRWLVEKFAPVPGWSQEQINALSSSTHGQGTSGASRVDSAGGRASVAGAAHNSSAPTKGAVWYTDNRAPADIRTAALGQLKRGLNGHALVTVGLEPESGIDLVLPLQRGYLAMFMQILAGLEALDTDIAFLVEHDCLYDTSHFDFTPPSDDCYWYDTNTWKVDAESGRAVTYVTKQTSGLCANRQLLVEHYRKRVDRVKREGFSRRMGFEPGSHRRKERIDDVPSDVWRSAVPIIDIRHGANLTSSRWSQAEFRDQRNCQGWLEADEVPGWGRTRGRFAEFLQDVGRVALTPA